MKKITVPPLQGEHIEILNHLEDIAIREGCDVESSFNDTPFTVTFDAILNGAGNDQRRAIYEKLRIPSPSESEMANRKKW